MLSLQILMLITPIACRIAACRTAWNKRMVHYMA